MSARKLRALERDLGRAASDEARAQLLDEARRKHRGLWHVASVVDQVHEACHDLLGEHPDDALLPAVYVITRSSELRAFLSLLHATAAEGSLALHLPAQRALVVYDAREDKQGGYTLNAATVQALVPGVFRQWIQGHVDPSPPWLVEGLAEYFARCELERGRLQLGLVPRDVERLPSGPFLLRPLLHADRAGWGRQAGVDTAHAWSLCHFLGSTEEGRQTLTRYVATLRRGETVAQAFTETFGDSEIELLEASWAEYSATLGN